MLLLVMFEIVFYAALAVIGLIVAKIALGILSIVMVYLRFIISGPDGEDKEFHH